MTASKRDKQLTVSEILSALRQFKGITRKSSLGELMPLLGENVYDDAGFLEAGNVKVVVSADGIVEGLVKDDPWLAGFYSVVVNVNDVVAKGARPAGFAHVVSSSSASTSRQIVQGIKQGLDKYGLKFLKGHTHPDTSYDAVDAVVVGLAHGFLSSDKAKPGDNLVVTVDVDGSPGLRGWVRTFDSVLFKTPKHVQTRLEGVILLAERKLADACRDISGPGVIGTTAMLCESSRVGARIAVEDIPKPKSLSTLEWLLTYPSTGFVLATDKPEECVKLLRKHEMAASVAGEITKTRAVQVSYRGQVETIFGAEKPIFGVQKTATLGSIGERDVKELETTDAPAIEMLLQKVWSAAYEYPEEWRSKRILTSEQISKEMLKGHHYFGVNIDNQLAGVYKASVTKDGLFGEHQSVDPYYKGLGLATAMYRQFINFAKLNGCRNVYVNILSNQIASRRILGKMGFRRKGREYRQAKGMTVQMYQLEV